jgi:hypothetical protein
MELMEWSRSIVNALIKRQDHSDYLYRVVLDFNPNPLNFDGMDELSIKIMRRPNSSFFSRTETVYLQTSDHCITLDQAMEEINKLVFLENDNQ